MNPENIRSAFPWVSHGGVHEHQFVESGLTKREYFAAMAMQGYLSSITSDDSVIEDVLAKNCFLMADAMVKASQVQP